MKMEHDYKKPHEGYMFRNKTNPDDFSSELYIGKGRSIDEWKEVPVSIHEKWQKEADERARNEIRI
jgi:hypothetical protein